MVSDYNIENGENMKVEYVIPEKEKQKIEDLQRKISDVEMIYVKKIEKFPLMEKKIRKDLLEDKNIEILRNVIEDIYMKSTTKILIEVESEEEMERLKSEWRI